MHRRLALFAVVGAIAVSYAGARYARVTEHVLPTTYRVTVDLAEAGGIFPGAEVTYRGVPVGRVGAVDPTSDGIAATLRIEDRWRVPADARAEVHNRSAVGEQYLDLVPADAGGPYLRDGDEITRSRTTTPLPEQELLASLDRFVGSVDTDDLGTVVTELGTAFEDNGDDLGRWVDGSSRFVTAARAHLPETVALLRHSAVFLRTQSRQSSAIASFSRDLAAITGTVRSKDAELRRIIGDGTPFARELTALVRGIDEPATHLFANVAALAAITGRRSGSVEEALAAFPSSISTVPVGARDRWAQFTLQLTSTPDSCQQGYIPPSRWRSTQETWYLPPDLTVGCTDPRLNRRGSAHAP
jgi:phospholipid/cholesterol/gamma-HCH transport system substrate-binding protein